MKFEQVVEAAFGRVAEQLNGSPTIEQLAMILQGLAAVQNASHAKDLTAFEFTAQVNNTSVSYTFEALVGRVQLLCVDGLVVRKKFWTWDSETKTLFLHNNYKITTPKTAELYFFGP